MTVITADTFEATKTKESGKTSKDVLRRVEGVPEVTIRVAREYFGWIKDRADIQIDFQLFYDPQNPNTRLLYANFVTEKKLAKELMNLDDNRKIDSASAVRDSHLLCLEALSKEHRITRAFKPVLTKGGNCLYARVGRDARTWVLRLPDVRYKGSYIPCFVRVASCVAVHSPVIISVLSGVSIDEAIRLANK